jgi:nucleotide-binding universal stress UspA family protein
MKKILLAIDGKNINMPALDFACYLGRLTNSKITGVFLENLVAEEKPVIKSMYGGKYLDWEVDVNSAEYKIKEQTIEKNISFFKAACERRCVNSSIHRDRGVPAREIIHESRYADLLVIDGATSFNKRYEGSPTEFVRDILQDAECPVIIAPESFDAFDEIVFTYNGSRSSVFAIKQFSYLLPQLSDKKATIIQVNKDGEWASLDKYNFKEWLQYHYSSVEFEILKGETDEQLFSHLLRRKNSFIVMGAYGRSGISRFFKHSEADLLIKTVTQPIFISHY